MQFLALVCGLMMLPCLACSSCLMACNNKLMMILLAEAAFDMLDTTFFCDCRVLVCLRNILTLCWQPFGSISGGGSAGRQQQTSSES
jgi:hypothetical protein